ncbi:MAG: sigma-70 family RNA polymerase sigma factor [Bacteroidia bacterium]|nr:sigma-70 family RNA polymerase sigma factor [Bacteroidia bacterium]
MAENYRKIPDQDLLAGLKSSGRERRDYEEILYKKYINLIWSRPRKYKLTEEEARQAYNDAIMGFLRQIDNEKFRGESSVYTYLKSIFIRKCIDIFRSGPTIDIYEESIEDNLHLPDSSVNLLKSLVSRDELENAMKLLAKLGEKCKELLLLSAEGFKMAEIAQMMGFKNPDSAYSNKHQCKKKLKELFKTSSSY